METIRIIIKIFIIKTQRKTWGNTPVGDANQAARKGRSSPEFLLFKPQASKPCNFGTLDQVVSSFQKITHLISIISLYLNSIKNQLKKTKLIN